MTADTDTQAKTLPYNPIDAAMKTPEHARRTIQGIIESYNGNYDAVVSEMCVE
jgi:hypothetical protein